jgi:hypothetical protein
VAHYDDFAREANDCAKRLAHFSIEPPTPAARWLARLHQLQQNPPLPAPHNGVAELLAAPEAPDEADVDAAIMRHLSAHHRAQQHGTAEKLVGRKALDAVLASRDELHKQLAGIADEIIAKLHAAAEITETLGDLTRQRRIDDATIVAHADSDAEQLLALYMLRNQFLTPAGAQWSTGLWSCENWSNPWNLQNHTGTYMTIWGSWREGIRHGGRLWFATFEEATAESSAHEPVDEPEPIDPANLVRWR